MRNERFLLSSIFLILSIQAILAQNLFQKSSGSSTTFEQVFKLLEVITLSQDKEIIGNVRECQIDNDGYIWILDSKMCKIRKYNRKGELLFSFGRKGEGPGEFFNPFSFFVGKERIYIVDSSRRLLSIFRKNGVFEKSFKIRDGRQVKKLESSNKIIISAPFLENEKGGFCLHMYNEEGSLIKSFFPIAEIVLKNHLLCDWVYFDLDGTGNIYAIQEMEYKIHKYSPNGEFLKSFSKINDYYISPPSQPFKEFYIKSSLENWVKSWTHISDLNIFDNLLIVSLHNYKSEEYFLDIYNLNGDFISGGLKTNYRLLCLDRNRRAYFLKEEEKSFKIIFSILKMAVNISN